MIAQSERLQEALEYAERGLFVLPAYPTGEDAKRPCVKGSWKNQSSRDPEQIKQWWSEFPDASIFIHAEPSGLAILDFDGYSPKFGPDAQRLLDDLRRDYPTPEMKRGDSSFKLVYERPTDMELSDSRGSLPEGIDVRMKGGVISPWSIHESGDTYEWVNNLPVATLPDFVRKMLETKRAKPADTSVPDDNELDQVIVDQALKKLKPWTRTAIKNYNERIEDRSKTEYGIAKDCFRAGLTDEEVDQVLISLGSKYANRAGLYRTDTLQGAKGEIEAERDAQTKIWLAIDTASAINNTDIGNGRRLVQAYGDNIRFVHERGKFYCWDGRRWAEDITGQVERFAKDTALRIYKEAAAASEMRDRQSLAAWAVKSESTDRLLAMMQRAKSEPGITVSKAVLDSDPYLFNCANGTIDLRTGELLPHRRGDLITKMADVDYDPSLAPTLWLKFLDKVQDGNQDVIDFLQRLVGYTMVGVVNEKVLPFLYGTGDNGKTVFTEIVMKLFGDYAMKLAVESLIQGKSSGGVPNDIAKLAGMRFVVSSETQQGGKLSDAKIKDLTGNDTIAARFMHQEWFEFTPTHTLWMYGNHRPIIKGVDPAIWNRVKQIPFTVTIPKSEQDKHLVEKLEAELPGILAWAVQGCLKWQTDGLGEPASVTVATVGYKNDMDTLKPFLEDECLTGTDPTTGKLYTISMKELYTAYRQWSVEEEDVTLGKIQFGENLTTRGILASNGSGNKAMREGITLKATVAKKEAIIRKGGMALVVNS